MFVGTWWLRGWVKVVVVVAVVMVSYGLVTDYVKKSRYSCLGMVG